MFNYALFKGYAQGRLSFVGARFYVWAWSDTRRLKLEMIMRKTSPPVVFHWNGKKSEDLAQLPRADILEFFRNQFLSR
jgi:hypothetical protein